MALDWERHHDLLKELWLTQDKTYDEVQAEMKQRHRFVASKNQYVTRFKQWKWRKNISSVEWRTVDREISRRKEQGRSSEVYLNNIRIPHAKIKKELSRHVPLTCRAAPVPIPQNFGDIRIRTPPPMISEDFSGNGYFDPSPVAMIPEERRFNAQIDIEPLPSKVSSTSVLSPRPDSFLQTHSAGNRLVTQAAKLPYFEFLDMFESLNLDEPLLQGTFFVQAPSPSLLPASSEFPMIMAEPNWNLDGEIYPYSAEKFLECSSSYPRTGQFYKSFANFLIPPYSKDQDQLEANLRLQKELPTMLANIPERNSGDSLSTIDTLLGPPNLNSAVCLLQTVVYLCSNNLLGGEWPSVQNYPIFQWVVETVPFRNLSVILKTKLPTILDFQSHLVLFAIRTGHNRLVKDLLDLDTGTREFFELSPKALRLAIKAGNAEMVELALRLSPKVFSPEDRWRQPLLEEGLSVEISQILVKYGVNVYESAVPDSSDTGDFRACFPLTAAIFRGDIGLVKFLVSVGADVNRATEATREDEEGEPMFLVTPLKAAVFSGSIELLHLLLENGANVHSVCKSGHYLSGMVRLEKFSEEFPSTAIQAAAVKGRMEMIIALLQAGSNVNEPAHGDYGQTALHAATKAGLVDTVQLLLRHGAIVDAPGTVSLEYPRTALLTAVERNDTALVNILLRSGANPQAPAIGYHGTTAIEAALARGNNNATVSLLLAESFKGSIYDNKLNSRVRTQYLRFQLFHAIARGDCEKVYRLIATGVNVDMDHAACRDLDQMKVSWWCTTRQMTHVTMLHLAVSCEEVELPLFAYLLKHLTTEALNYNDTLQPLLHHAIGRGRIAFAEALLDHGAHINAISLFGETDEIVSTSPLPTALHVASAMKDVNAIRLLLDRGADIDLRLPRTDFPLQAYFNNGWWDSGVPERLFDVVDLFLDRGADINALPAIPNGPTALQFAARRGTVPMVQRLLDSGAAVNAPPAEHDGQTALQAACQSGGLELVTLLLDHGANIESPNATSVHGTCLKYATIGGYFKVAEVLLARGADVNVRSSGLFGGPLAAATITGTLDMVQLFLNAGADNHLPLRERYVSSLRYAKRGFYPGIVSLLQKYRDKAREKWDEIRVQEFGEGREVNEQFESGWGTIWR